MPDYWLTVGAAALIAAVTSAIVSMWGVSRNIKHKAVIEERQNWRQALRELVPAFVGQEDMRERERMRNAIVLRLNPYKDREAVCLLNKYVLTPTPEAGHELVEHFQEMLKLEWQRAKRESGLIPWGAGWRAGRSVERQKRRVASSGSSDATDTASSQVTGASERPERSTPNAVGSRTI